MSLVLSLSLAAQAQNLTWDFGSGTREGWVVVLFDDYVPLSFDRTFASTSLTPTVVVHLEGSVTATSGS